MRKDFKGREFLRYCDGGNVFFYFRRLFEEFNMYFLEFKEYNFFLKKI